MEDALAELWKCGALLDWSAYFAGQRRRRVSLPTYPFERTLHWIEPPAGVAAVHANLENEVESMSVQAESGAVEAVGGVSRALRLRGLVAEVLTDLSGIATHSGRSRLSIP